MHFVYRDSKSFIIIKKHLKTYRHVYYKVFFFNLFLFLLLFHLFFLSICFDIIIFEVNELNLTCQNILSKKWHIHIEIQSLIFFVFLN